jgi:hypothetical protein
MHHQEEEEKWVVARLYGFVTHFSFVKLNRIKLDNCAV